MMLGAVATVAGTALAKRDGGPGGRGDLLGHIERGVGRLELAADAKQAVYAALDEARTQRRALGDQLRAAHDQMKATLDATAPSLDVVLAQVESIGALETQARKIELTAVVKIRQLLTGEQWQRLRDARGSGQHGLCGGDAPASA